MNLSTKTLAETFQTAGYATAGFVTNPHLSPAEGFSQGYDDYLNLRQRWTETPAQALNEKALSWLEGVEGPFFLYLHYMDIHFPYDPPPPFRTLYSEERSDLDPLRVNGPGEFQREIIDYSIDLYDAQINYWDDRFGDLIEMMERTGSMRDTVVVVVADHGEEFDEHSGFGHGFTTYGEVLHVPLIVVHEGEVPSGIVRTDLVGLVDIAPTVRSLAGLDPTSPVTEGIDLFADETARPAKRAVYSETYQGQVPRSLRTSNHQLIYNAAEESWEFYGLKDDPMLLHDRIRTASDIDEALVADLQSQLLGRMDPKRAVKSESVELDDETIEELKGLGYLQ